MLIANICFTRPAFAASCIFPGRQLYNFSALAMCSSPMVCTIMCNSPMVRNTMWNKGGGIQFLSFFFHSKVGFFWGGISGFVYLQRRVHTKLGDLTKRFDCALWGSNSGRRSDTTIYHLLFTHNSQFIISNIVLLSERRSSKEGAHRITIGPTTMPNSTARSTGVHHRHPVCAAQCTRSTPSLQCARPT